MCDSTQRSQAIVSTKPPLRHACFGPFASANEPPSPSEAAEADNGETLSICICDTRGPVVPRELFSFRIPGLNGLIDRISEISGLPYLETCDWPWGVELNAVGRLYPSDSYILARTPVLANSDMPTMCPCGRS